MRQKNKKKPDVNYLDLIPEKNPAVGYHLEENQIVVLELENKGAFNRAAQKLFHRPKFSYIHLDEFGSVGWIQVDGTKTIAAIALEVKAHFGKKAEPLYERLIQYFYNLENYGFVMIPKNK